MSAVRRALLFAGLSLAAFGASGCTSFWHDLQPHRLHRMNRGPGMMNGTDAYSAIGATRPTVG